MPNHIIHKQKVHLQTNISADAFSLQKRISNLLKNDMADKLEDLFNKISPNGTVIRIDKLEINLGTINKQNLETEFSEELVKQLSNSLSDLGIKSSDPKFTEIKHGKSLIDSLLFFLSNGYMLWYSSVKNMNDWETDMLDSFSQQEWQLLTEELKRNQVENYDTVKRLLTQFSNLFLERILSELHDGFNKNKVNSLIEIFNRETDGDQKVFWECAITTALSTTNEKDFTIAFLKKINEKNGDAALNSEAIIAKKNERKAGEEFFITNCGMIILHPFLVMYFQELGLVENNIFINTENRNRALLLLYYLSTGHTEVPEYNLLLEKLLCAIDFDEPVPNHIALTEKEKEESANLLQSVTQHWKPLNRTSIEGLQSSFFQREGKLIKKETGWLLQVEQKTIDILLDKLPWGIGTIKLPWMKEVLHVEWC